MQEEVENRAVTLVISATKLTGRLLKAAILKYLASRKEKRLQKARAAPEKPTGKQTVSDKYDITKHPNYKYLSDANPKNAFDIEKFLSTKLKLKPEEEFEVFDAGAAAGSESA